MDQTDPTKWPTDMPQAAGMFFAAASVGDAWLVDLVHLLPGGRTLRLGSETVGSASQYSRWLPIEVRPENLKLPTVLVVPR